MFRAAESAAMACADKLDGLPIDSEMLALVRQAAEAWNDLLGKAQLAAIRDERPLRNIVGRAAA